MSGSRAGRAAARVAIEPLGERHFPAVTEIHVAGIATGHATFETTPPAWTEFDRAKLSPHRHVAVDERGVVLGWIAAAQVSERPVYAGVVEHSVYVHPDAGGRGIGHALVDALIASTEAAGIWTIQAGIFRENLASLSLHRAAGFREVGIRERLGLMSYGPLAGQWRDVVLLERRSSAF